MVLSCTLKGHCHAIWQLFKKLGVEDASITFPVLSVRFEVGVSLLLAHARADKRKAPFPLVENAGIQPAICKRVPAGAPAGAGSY